MNIIFFGTSVFASSLLSDLQETSYKPAYIVTQPDKVGKRNNQLLPPPVKTTALSLGYGVETIFQPNTLRDEAVCEMLASLQPDLIIVAAYGKILPQRVLDLPKYKCINVHASLLPRHRGASPIFTAIASGDKETGVSIMVMDAGMDTGPVLGMQKLTIPEDATTASLESLLSICGSEALLDILPQWIAGNLQPQEQPTEGITLTKLLTKEDGFIDWTDDAVSIERQIRASSPWPGAWTFWQEKGKRIVVHKAVVVVSSFTSPPGTVHIHDGKLLIICGKDALEIREIQIEGKPVMPTKAFLNGYQAINGTSLISVQ